MMEKKDFMVKIDDGSYAGNWMILYDRENRWGPIVTKKQADEAWSLFKNSGLSFEEWLNEYD